MFIIIDKVRDIQIGGVTRDYKLNLRTVNASHKHWVARGTGLFIMNR